MSSPEVSILHFLYYFKNIISYTGTIGSIMDLRCIYSSRRFQNTLQFVTSFHIDKDIAKTTQSGVRFKVKDIYNYFVYREYCNLVQIWDNILCAPVVLSMKRPGVFPSKNLRMVETYFDWALEINKNVIWAYCLRILNGAYWGAHTLRSKIFCYKI